MDAYVLVAGGDPEVRKIQQWLNGRYWRRSFATLIPTEGHYSRDVQKLLMKALQSEFGIADASVNGNFGPATQRQLAAHSLKPGDSGVLVELLSAACVFNGAVPSGEDMVHTCSRLRLMTSWPSIFRHFKHLVCCQLPIVWTTLLGVNYWYPRATQIARLMHVIRGSQSLSLFHIRWSNRVIRW